MPVIEITHLRKRYGRVVAVDDVSLSVERGEIFGIVGRNGAGKTTTVEIISGLRTADGGHVTVLGLDPRRDRAELRRRVGVQLQSSQLPEKITVAEALRLYATFYPQPADVDALAAELGLSELMGRRYATLSGGQQQRLSIALALIGDPEMVVLDELTTGLDPRARRDTWGVVERVRDRGVTVVLVTHVMEEAERLCDRVAVVDDGRVVALDSPAGLVAGVTAEQSEGLSPRHPRQRLRFRPTTPLDESALAVLPEVTSVERLGDDVVLSGSGDLLFAVTATLSALGVRLSALRMDTMTLDDAFLALTGCSPAEELPTTTGGTR